MKTTQLHKSAFRRLRIAAPIAPLLDEPGGDADIIEEVAAQVGQAGWIDPETGALAEESRVRIEEH